MIFFLFGLTHLLTSNGKSFEDLSLKEKDYQKELIDYIISIYYEVNRMSKQGNLNIDELKGILDGIFNFIDVGYSFKNASIIDNLEKIEDNTEVEKIEVLKSYIQLNMANNQRALNLLEELTEKK